MPFLANVDQIATFVCSVLGVAVVCAVVAWRLLVQYRNRGRLDCSDICMVTSAIAFLSLHVLAFCSLEGVGKYKIVYAYGPVWSVAFACSKLSVLQTYATAVLPGGGRGAVVVQMAMAFVVVAGLAGLFGGLFLCQPVSVFWTSHAWDRCGNVRLYYVLLCTINVVVDLFVVVLPMPAMWKLQIAFGIKKVVMGMFGGGLIAVAVTIWKVIVAAGFHIQDATHEFFLVMILSGLEIAATLVISCLPFLRPKWLQKQDVEAASATTPPSSPSSSSSSSSDMSQGSRTSAQFPIDIRAIINTNWAPPPPGPASTRRLSMPESPGGGVRDSYVSTGATRLSSHKSHRRDDSSATCTNSIIVETTWEIKTEEHLATMSWPSSPIQEWTSGQLLERCPTAIYEEGRDLPFLSGRVSSVDQGEATVIE